MTVAPPKVRVPLVTFTVPLPPVAVRPPPLVLMLAAMFVAPPPLVSESAMKVRFNFPLPDVIA